MRDLRSLRLVERSICAKLELGWVVHAGLIRALLDAWNAELERGEVVWQCVWPDFSRSAIVERLERVAKVVHARRLESDTGRWQRLPRNLI